MYFNLVFVVEARLSSTWEKCQGVEIWVYQMHQVTSKHTFSLLC